MRIAVNTQHLLKDRLEGIGWFAHETLRRLVKDHPEHEFIFIFDRKWDKSFIYGHNVTPVSAMIPSPPVLWFWHYEIDIPRILRKYKPTLFFSPDGWMSTINKGFNGRCYSRCEFYATCRRFSLFLPEILPLLFSTVCAKARRLITVSEYSKTDIVNTLSIDPSKIDVAYNGAAKFSSHFPTRLKSKSARNSPTGIHTLFL